MKHIASCSFGKDSCAMVLKIIELGLPIDEVVFYDTGAEFDAIYKVRDFIVKNYLEPNGIKYTELHPQCPFFYKMLEKPVNKKDGTKQNGYHWCGGRCRWGTTEKLIALERYAKDCVEYIGLAYDEPKRLQKPRKGNKVFVLADQKMTESDCLEYCRSKGIKWEENGIDLYDILDRVSCWCCANKNKKELYAYYKHLPEYWARLKDLQHKIDRPFNRQTIDELEEEFKKKEIQRQQTLF